MRCLAIVFPLLLALSVAGQVANEDPVIYPGQDRTFGFHGAAGGSDTTAISMSDPAFVGWVTGYQDLNYGSGVSDNFKTPTKALGPALGGAFDIVCLGRGGRVTLTFANSITNGAGFDFAVFENSYNDRFLELAWVEVSSDGVHFVRFPNFSYTESAVGPFSEVEPSYVHGFAGKYIAGFGTPFDLSELQLAYDAAMADTDVSFTAEYEDSLETNFPHLDLENIRYVRLIDVIGDGSARDVDGNVVDGDNNQGGVVYDPYPTFGSPGFDLDAVGVLNQVEPSGIAQTIDFLEIPNQRLSVASLQLTATATSGLPVEYVVMEGAATVSGVTLTIMGLGQIIVQATQPGDATYASAVPVSRSFYVADALQHIFIRPLANQLTDAVDVQVAAVSSSGLPVRLFVDSGPSGALVSELTHQFSSGSEAGAVTIRASQVGGALGGLTYAPASDVRIDFEIVIPGSSVAPRTFSDWQTDNALAGGANLDSDQDGASDLEEYAAGTDPNGAGDRPRYSFESWEAGEGFVFELSLDERSLVDFAVETTGDFSAPVSWVETVPEILSIENGESGSSSLIRTLHLRLPTTTGDRQFWQIRFTQRD